MENRDDSGLEKEPQELDTDDLFPEPSPIPTIDLSPLAQPEYTPEAIEQIQIPEIPPPPPIPVIDLDSLSFVPEATSDQAATESPPPAATPEVTAPAPAAGVDEQVNGNALWQQVLTQEKPEAAPDVEALPAFLEKLDWSRAEPTPVRRGARRPASWSKAGITIFVLLVILPMLCCCAVNYIGD
jgi:hypothetical protein